MNNGIRFMLLLAMLSLFAFMPGDRVVVAASPDLPSGHFQLQAVIVDVPVTGRDPIPTHELFLLDADTGKVWRYRPNNLTQTLNGTPTLIPAAFDPIPVNQPKQ